MGKMAGKVEGSPGNRFLGLGRGKEPEEADRRQLRASSGSNGGRPEEC